MSSDSENEHNDAEDVDPMEKEKIRSEISSMSFEDLQKLKQKIGAKVLNEKVFGAAPSKEQRTQFKRANKNRPREISSKIRPKPLKIPMQMKAPVSRDPRFDPLCGTYDESSFKHNYKFLRDVRKNEKVVLKKELQKEEDPEKKKKLRALLQRINNQIGEQEKDEKEKAEQFEKNKEIKRKLKQGIKPVFKKKSETRLEGLINKYEELKKNNKLEKHIERRTKKLANKDRKKNKL